MNSDIYPTQASTNFIAYDFISKGRKGEIRKGVRYTQTGFTDIWNLAFGDINADTGDMDDSIVSNNGDSEKVLATVARTCVKFTDHFPGTMIFAIGSTPSRTRLYQMGISRYLNQILELFTIKGLLENSWQEFEKDINYKALLIKRL